MTELNAFDVGYHSRYDLLRLIDHWPGDEVAANMVEVLNFIRDLKANAIEGCGECRGELFRIIEELETDETDRIRFEEPKKRRGGT